MICIKRKIALFLTLSSMSISSIGLISVNATELNSLIREDYSIVLLNDDESFSIDSEKWDKIQDHTIKTKLFDLSKEKLKNISTNELIEVCLNYPLLIDMFAYNSLDEGFEAVKNQSNAFYELTLRKDSSKCLLNIYQNTTFPSKSNYDKTKQENNLELCDDLFKATSLEVIISQNVFVSQLSENELEIMAKSAKEKLSYKQNNKEIYSDNSKVISENIIKAALSYDGYINGYGYYLTSVKTPKNSSVTAFNVQQDMTQSEKDSYKKQVATSYPRAVYLGSATAKYNCHSYAWYTTTGQYWINNPSTYMTDGSYSSCSYSTNTKMTYTTNGSLTHSSIVSTIYAGPSQYNFVDL